MIGPRAAPRKLSTAFQRARRALRDAWQRWGAPVWDDPRVVASACQRAYFVWRAGGATALAEWYAWKMRFQTPEVTAADWWSRYQRGAWRRRLRRLSSSPAGADFTIVLAPRLEQPTWWRAAIDSVRAQVYKRWELLVVAPASTAPATIAWLRRLEAADPRIQLVLTEGEESVVERFNRGMALARGQYVALLDESDALEPEALSRWNQAAAEGSGLLYGDEVVCTHDLADVQEVRALPAFSYDFFLASDYLPTVWAARRELLLAVHGLSESADRYDLLLRLCERTDCVAHTPGVVSRRRRHSQRPATADGREAVARHLGRIGSAAAIHVRPGSPRDLVYPVGPKCRVAAVIPTRDRADLLEVCLRTIEPVVARGQLDLVVIDHESQEPQTLELLERVAARHRVIGYRGVFNFSAMMNHAVAATAHRYTHYLLLNNDIEALDSAWLEHMLGLASRQDVAVVGATLLYPDRRVQHAGVVTGLCGAAAHAHVLEPYYAEGRPRAGYIDTLSASRDVSAVTGACLLVRADVLDQLGGFDERLRVGFGDVDLCLRARAAGYKVLYDAQAVLVHHESLTRGKRFWGAHPDDSLYFAARYFRGAAASDPFYNPLLSPVTARYVLNRQARALDHHAPRTQRVQLPARASKLWDAPPRTKEAA